MIPKASKKTSPTPSVLSVSFVSLAPARPALRANFRWYISKAPAFSVAVKSFFE